MLLFTSTDLNQSPERFQVIVPSIVFVMLMSIIKDPHDLHQGNEIKDIMSVKVIRFTNPQFVSGESDHV